MDLAIATTSFECTIDGGLAHIVLNQPDRGNPIDGDFCREFNLCMAELSERDDVRSVLISARGRLFSVGGDLAALASRGDALPVTIKSWTADLHAAIVRMVRMRAPVVVAVQGNVAGGSVSLMAAGDLVVIGKSARISSAFAKIGFGDQKRAQSLRRNQKRFDVALGMAIDQRDPARELTDFSEKLTRPLIDDRRDVTEAVALADRDMARQNDEHARSRLAGLEQFFAILVISDLAEPAHPRDFLRRQRRECLLKAWKHGRQRRAAICFASSRGVLAHFSHIALKEKTCPVPNPAIRPAFFRFRHVVGPHHHSRAQSWRRCAPSPAIFAA